MNQFYNKLLVLSSLFLVSVIQNLFLTKMSLIHELLISVKIYIKKDVINALVILKGRSKAACLAGALVHRKFCM